MANIDDAIINVTGEDASGVSASVQGTGTAELNLTDSTVNVSGDGFHEGLYAGGSAGASVIATNSTIALAGDGGAIATITSTGDAS